MALLDDLAKTISEGRIAPPDDPDTEKACPTLWVFLTQHQWGDGTVRMLPQIVIERIGGGYRVTLRDDSLCVRKGATCVTLSEAFTALEKALVDGSVPWEDFKSYRNKQGPKVPVDGKRPGRKRS